MTDRQRIESVLQRIEDEYLTFEDFICVYLNLYRDDIDYTRLIDIRDNINNEIDTKLTKVANAIHTAIEKSLYLKTYLEGNMYTENADPDACRQVQLMNAKTLFDTVTGVKL